ncbi:hypothetical protein HAZT_HAZT005793 [Hyalella azteca]|uniref:Uncharacterized protein n=1 Tax=Hyalella azteca TaxID=294128 RepID=A0A6A0H5Q9_HYAAZ|nr:hypothetical protein HAZT_HAZT005793 [Hyalella azteca]
MAQYRAPDELNFDGPKGDTWKSCFMTFRKVMKLDSEDDEIQVASLKYCIGKDSEDDVKTLRLTAEEQKNFDTVLGSFDEYFKPNLNIIRLRRQFQRRNQLAGESEERTI